MKNRKEYVKIQQEHLLRVFFELKKEFNEKYGIDLVPFDFIIKVYNDQAPHKYQVGSTRGGRLLSDAGLIALKDTRLYGDPSLE